MKEQPQTWHYGLVARYWAEQVTDGPEIAYFQGLIESNGHPALDAGCGTGRLLIPFLGAGLDVDGVDVSPDMLSLCREKAEAQGLQPRLYQQALHELDLPRTYETIVACGALGIGVNRQQDILALRRFHHHLNPGGLLLINLHLPYGNAGDWQLWLKEKRDQLPRPWPNTMGKIQPDDGSDLELHHRTIAFDPLEQCVTRQIHMGLWREGQCVAEEEYTLTDNMYFRSEFQQMLEIAGFKVEAIEGAYTEDEATADDDILVFIARKHS